MNSKDLENPSDNLVDRISSLVHVDATKPQRLDYEIALAINSYTKNYLRSEWAPKHANDWHRLVQELANADTTNLKLRVKSTIHLLLIDRII